MLISTLGDVFPSRLRVCQLAVLLLALELGLAASAAAQGTNGLITGVITDAQGGVLPGVTVTVRNSDSGVSRTTVTEGDGRYRFAALPSGRYDLKAELQGFAASNVTGLTLTINLELRQDLTMGLSALQESVTVTGQSPVVETTKSEISSVITQEQISALPVGARQAVSLALLLPGTSQDGTRPRRNNAQIGAGTLQFTSNHLVDGTMNMSIKAGEPREDFPQSAILEFKVLTSQAPAEYGGRAGGVVSIVTKGGGNLFSGEAYEFFSNKNLGRVDKFAQATIDQTGQSKPQYERHQFGGALGGPVIKNRLHFFIAAEDTSQKTSYTIYTGQPQFYGKFEGIFSNESPNRLFFVRGDSELTSKQNVFVRWGYQGNTLYCEGCGGNSVAGNSDTYIPRDSLVVGHTWVLGPRLLNEARFQWAQQTMYQAPVGAGFYKQLDYGLARTQNVSPTYNFPSFSWGGDNFFITGQKIREFRDDVSIASAHHNVKIGGAFQSLPLEEDVQGNQLGTWNFAVDQVFDPTNPVVMANLRGPINTFTAAFPFLLRHQPHHYYQVYAQDEWRPLSSLTLNLGVRYDLDTLVWNKDRKNDASFYPRVLPLVDFASRGDNNNVSPRLGLAWDVRDDGKTVVRAAAGRQYNVIMNGTPGAEETTLRQTSINISNPSYPDPYRGRTRESFASTAPPNISIVANDMVNPYSDTYSLGFSQQLRANMAINVDGVYTKSDKFNASVQINTPDPVTKLKALPDWGRILQVQSIGWQKYEALLVRFEKRLSNRHQYLISYTLAKVTDNSFSGTSTGTITDFFNQGLDEGYGNSDRRHALVASGAYLLPGDLTLGAVWTIRTTAPFSARAGKDLNNDGTTVNGQQTDYVPGTHKGQGNRDLDLALVNAWRALPANGALAPIPASQMDGNGSNKVDVRLSKAIALGGNRKLDVIAQVFNLLGTDNIGGIGSSWVTNALSSEFGRIQTAQPRQQAEVAARIAW